jgi:hypothetical protein
MKKAGLESPACFLPIEKLPRRHGAINLRALPHVPLVHPLEHAGNTVMPTRVLRAVDDDHMLRVRRPRRQRVRVDVDDLHISNDSVRMRRRDRGRARQTQREDACLNCSFDSHACTSGHEECKELASLMTR